MSNKNYSKEELREAFLCETGRSWDNFDVVIKHEYTSWLENILSGEINAIECVCDNPVHWDVGGFIRLTNCANCGKDVPDNLIGKECFYVDKTTFEKKFDGKPLGICLGEGIHSLHKKPIVWFQKPFLGNSWQFKEYVRL